MLLFLHIKKLQRKAGETVAYLDYNKILSANPTKELMIAYNELRSSFSQDNEQNKLLAEAYKEKYQSKPLSFILENSRYIFCEPHYGYDFYKENVINNKSALMFMEYEYEMDKLYDYVAEFGSLMNDIQREKYEALCQLVEEKYQSTLHTNYVLHHMSENGDQLYHTLQDRLYSESLHDDFTEVGNDVIHMLESCDDKDLFFAITPYVNKVFIERANDEQIMDFRYMMRLNQDKFVKECDISYQTINEDDWKHYIENCVIVNQLYQDPIYVENVNAMIEPSVKETFMGYGLESVSDQVNELYMEHVCESGHMVNPYNSVESYQYNYVSPKRAVERIFEDNDMYTMMESENHALKEKHDRLYDIAVEVVGEYVQNEYDQYIPGNEISYGYGFFENASVDEIYDTVVMEKVFGKTPGSLVGVTGGDYARHGSADARKLPNAPQTSGGMVGKIQNRAMDIEAKQMRAYGNAKQKGMGLKGAAKAVAALPANVANDIKKTASDWSEMRDDKKKEMIKAPGYRKSIFKKLKTALMYGGAAAATPMMIPALWIYRHFSKINDKRLKNELIRELQTEIEITQEKINDAQGDDKHEKYELMRIKSQLEKELQRVQFNSKTI